MITSIFMESYIIELRSVMKDITKLFNDNNIDFVFIGGAARNLYNVNKTTEDIDILVDIDDKYKLLNLPIGYIREISRGRGKVFIWNEPKTRIEVIYDGEISGDGINGLEYVKPKYVSTIIEGVPTLSIYKLIEYKLSSGIYGDREKDFADIRQLIKANNLTVDLANNFRNDLKIKYIELWDKENKSNLFDKEFDQY